MIIIAKFCCVCNCAIYGNARKYCEDCKRKEHLEQMAKYYRENTARWQYDGDYYKRRRGVQLCGTGGLGSHSTFDWDLEMKKVKKEKLNLGLDKKTY